jgi:2-hydroxychromene-2-carboxylate isomerase
MKQLTFYYDVISPYAYLAFMQLPKALQGLSVSVDYKPVVFAGLLKHHGQLGPAEIAPKRDWTFRQVAWLARELGVRLDAPAAHPFNPVPLLRAGLAASADAATGHTNRFITNALFSHVWTGGQAADDAARLATFTEALDINNTLSTQEIKDRLIHNGEDAIARGVFGVPSVVADERLFWGLDALPMLRAYLQGDTWFAESWQASAALATGVQRRR